MNERSDFVNFNRIDKLPLAGDTTNPYSALSRQNLGAMKHSLAACKYPDDAVVCRHTYTRFSGVSEISQSSNQPYLDNGVFKEWDIKENKWNKQNR